MVAPPRRPQEGTGGGSGGVAGAAGSGSSYAAAVVSGPTFKQNISQLFGQVVVTYRYVDAPNAPTLGEMPNGSFVDAFGDGVTLGFTYMPGEDSGALTAMSLRLQASGGVGYEYLTSPPGLLWLDPLRSGTRSRRPPSR